MSTPLPADNHASVAHTVTCWIRQVKEGDGGAAQQLWEAYFQRMVGLARQKLVGSKKAVADEEDVALSAFKSFCLGAQAGRFTQLLDSDNLWPLLMAITANKSVDYIRRENRQKRGGGQIQAGGPIPLSDLIGKEPDPKFAAELAEQFAAMMELLETADDPDLKEIALKRMEGASTEEIAAGLGCVRRTVERKLVVIRSLWERSAE